jgi:hypothetical protein
MGWVVHKGHTPKIICLQQRYPIPHLLLSRPRTARPPVLPWRSSLHASGARPARWEASTLSPSLPNPVPSHLDRAAAPTLPDPAVGRGRGAPLPDDQAPLPADEPTVKAPRRGPPSRAPPLSLPSPLPPSSFPCFFFTGRHAPWTASQGPWRELPHRRRPRPCIQLIRAGLSISSSAARLHRRHPRRASRLPPSGELPAKSMSRAHHQRMPRASQVI